MEWPHLFFFMRTASLGELTLRKEHRFTLGIEWPESYTLSSKVAVFRLKAAPSGGVLYSTDSTSGSISFNGQDLVLGLEPSDLSEDGTTTLSSITDIYKRLDFSLSVGDQGELPDFGFHGDLIVAEAFGDDSSSPLEEPITVQLGDTVVSVTLSGVGPRGDAATISIGTVSSVASNEAATVTNSGTSQAAVLDFEIPQGATGPTGNTGPAHYAASVEVLGRNDGIKSFFDTHNGDTGTGAGFPLFVAPNAVTVKKVSISYLSYNNLGSSYDELKLDFGTIDTESGELQDDGFEASWEPESSSGVTVSNLSESVSQGNVFGVGFLDTNSTELSGNDYFGLVITVIFEDDT